MRKCKAKGGLLILMGFLVSYGGCTVRMGDEYSQPQNRTITRSNRRQFMWKKFDELMAQGRFEEAVQEANRLLNSFGDYDKGYNNRAVAYQSLKQYDQALADFNKAILLNPQDTGFYYNRGGLYVQIEKYDFAVSDFNKAIEINPAYAHGHFGLGLVHNGKGQYDQAITHFEKAISLNPSVYYFLFIQSACLCFTGEIR